MIRLAAICSACCGVAAPDASREILHGSRTFFRATWFALVLAVDAYAASTVIEWRGTLQEKGTATFALIDQQTGVSKWVKLGGQFESYSVSQYDKNKQTLVLEGNGARLELSPAAAVLLPVLAADDGLENLSGMALADALANRGDMELRLRLGEHRGAILVRQETDRQIAAEERLQRVREKVGAQNPAMAHVATDGEAEILKMRKDAQRQDADIERMANGIMALAVQKRAALQSH